LEAVLLRHPELAVAGSGGDHHRPPQERGAIVQSDFEESGEGAWAKFLRVTGHDHPHAELDGLQLGAERKVRAGDAGRKSEEVFDAGRGGGLAAERHIVKQDGPQAFGGTIDRR
jgi:hypothetical protein